MPRIEHTLRFLGGAGTVTGSKFLVDSGSSRVLLDCGLFQGYKELRLRNREMFPVPPASLDAALITHAHIDHSGYLPALVRDGFQGPILATDATRALATLLLPDSAYLMEEEAEYARKKGYSKHADPQPLYTSADAKAALALFRNVEREHSYDVAEGIQASWHQAGHIIGASSIAVTTPVGKVYFSGDLGTTTDALMKSPDPYPGSDILVMESTYGNRNHSPVAAEDQLAELVGPVVERGGVVLIPAFAVGRTQTVLLHLSRLMDAKRIPETRIFINSPMAANASEMYEHFVGDQKIDPHELARVYERATLVKSVDQSIALNQASGPMIIISAAGMLTGGRVLHHLMAFGGSPQNAIILSGFQAGGTRGADLVAGKRTLRMFGEDVEIKAPVHQLDSMSAHADADGLLEWMSGASTPPRMTYLVHGETDAATALQERITKELGWKVRVARYLEEVDLAHPV
jgi:metallo-beta-lactamase family protein